MTQTEATSTAPAGLRASPGQRLGAMGRMLLAPQPVWLLRAAMSLLVLLTIALHIAVIRVSTGAGWDIDAFKLQAATVFEHQNIYRIYQLKDRYPYPPVWVWIIAAMRQLAWTLHIPFDQAAKLPALVGDVGICLLMFGYLCQRLGTCWAAVIPAALYAINPLAILISAGHGQFDALVIMFLLLALYLRGPQADRHPAKSALALGIGIALKGFPVLALPYLALTAPRGHRVRTVVYAFIPLVVAMLVYTAVFGVSKGIVTHVIGYQSTYDFGWAGLHSAHISSIVLQPWILRALELLLIVFAAAVPAALFGARPAAAMSIIFLALYATTPTMSVQYLIWVVPFLLLALPVGAVLFSIVAVVGALSFYNLVSGAIPTFASLPAIAARLWPMHAPSVGAIILVSWVLGVYLVVERVRAQRLPKSVAETRASLLQYLGPGWWTSLPFGIDRRA